MVDHKTTHYKSIIRSCAKNANRSKSLVGTLSKGQPCHTSSEYVHMQSKCNMHMHASTCTHSLSAHAMQTYSQNECTGTCISCSRWCTESACLLYLAMEAPVHLGRSPADECSTQLNCPDCPPFTEKVMDVSGGNATFIVNIGPTGSERGYMAIAGRLSACGCFVFPPF